MKIEKIAVTEIERIVSCTDLLDPVFDRDEKTPSWDGFIYAYKTSAQRKDEMYGRAPVQIKGTTRDTINTKGVSFRVNYADLENYRKDGGALYFVVKVENKKPSKVYYSALLPRVLNDLLKQRNGKKSFNLPLKPIPLDSRDLEDLVINFIENKRRQSIPSQDNWTIERVAEVFNLEKATIVHRFHNVYDNKDSVDYMLNHYTEMYVRVESVGIEFPVGSVILDHAQKRVSAPVCVDGVKCFDSYDIRRDKKGHTIIVGDFLEIALEDEKKLIHFNLNGDLKTQIIQAEFLLDLFRTGTIQVGEKTIDIKFDKESEDNKRSIKELQKRYDGQRDLEKMLDILSVNESLCFDEWTENDSYYAEQLIKAFVYDEAVKIPKSMNVMSIIKIGNLNIGVLIDRSEKDVCRLRNMFDKCQNYCLIFDDTKEPTSIYTMLKKDNFLKLSNTNYDVLLESIKHFHNASHYTVVNRMILEMLGAYDEKENRELLETISSITEWLYSEDENPYTFLNWCQTLVRINSGDKRIDKKAIKEIYKESEDEALRAGAAILLGRNNEAKEIIERMNDEDKELFFKYPISHLLQTI